MTSSVPGRWTAERAAGWYERLPWPCGFNYLPRTAVNATEMWQAETFDRSAIAEELGWARDLGLNACRVFLPFLVWDADPDGFLCRLDAFCAEAAVNGIRLMPILFDDCAFAGREPSLGPQAPPVPGVHNSGWTASPGRSRVRNRAAWPRLREYVASVVGAFRDDARILAWDLYNEPGNDGMGESSLPLLEAAFRWAREAVPSQPLTSAVWNVDLAALNARQTALSDVLSFHDYEDLESAGRWVRTLRKAGGAERPILCTEWLRRGHTCEVATHLPFFQKERIGCFFWQLVNGRTQTHFPWGSPEGAAESDTWFHDLLRTDGTPHRPEETDLIRTLCRPDPARN